MLHKTYIVLFISLLLTNCGSPLNKMRSEDQRSNLSDQKKVSKDGLLRLLDYNIRTAWTKGPYGESSSSSSLLVEFYDDALEPISLPSTYSLFITAEMGMGHGLADRGFFETLDQQSFLNQEIKFYMNGAYNMTLYLYEGDIELGRATWSFTL